MVEGSNVVSFAVIDLLAKTVDVFNHALLEDACLVDFGCVETD